MINRTLLAAALAVLPLSVAQGQPSPPNLPPAAREGAHDFDFLIGDWKAHLRKLDKPLTGAGAWIEYDGTSSHKKVLGSDANLEDFEVTSRSGAPAIHAQTLRLYNPASRTWSIYLLDLAKGTLSGPPTVGGFDGAGRGEFFDFEEFRGRWILVRYVWVHPTTASARMEQAFSTDGGGTWEVNWICELTRAGP
jgi:hypothetical protein